MDSSVNPAHISMTPVKAAKCCSCGDKLPVDDMVMVLSDLFCQECGYLAQRQEK